MADGVRWAVPSNQSPQLQGASSRLVSGLTTTTGIVTAAAVGRVRVYATADATPIPIELLLPPLAGRGKTTTPKAARLQSRIQAVRVDISIVTAQASGLVRVRSTAAASVVVQASAVGRVRVRGTADATSVPVVFQPILGRGKTTTPKAARLQSRILVARVAGLIAAQASGLVRVRSTATASVIVQVSAVGRVRVRASADASVIASAVPTPLRPQRANQGPARRVPSSRVITGLVTTPGPGLVQAAAVGIVRVRSTADASVITTVTPVLRPIQGRLANTPAPFFFASRIFEYREFAIVQAPGRAYVRLRSTADATAIAPARRVLVGDGRRTTPKAARLRSRVQDVRPEAGVTTGQAAGRVRVRATAAASVSVFAAAQGRVRVRAAAVGTRILAAVASGRIRLRAAVDAVVIAPVLRALVGEGKNTTPQAARLHTRIQDVRPPAGFVFAQAVGKVRVRGTAAASVVVRASANGRVRVRAATVGTNLARSTAVGRVRVRSKALGIRMLFGIASGRVRVRSTARSNFVLASARGRVRVRGTARSNFVLAGAHGRVRVRSKSTAIKTVIARGHGRFRFRGTGTATTTGQGIILSPLMAGRIRLRAKAILTAIDVKPRWPQGTDPDRWPQGTDGDRWPQGTDADRWPQGTDGDRWPQSTTTNKW